jgi:hypothetical protein
MAATSAGPLPPKGSTASQSGTAPPLHFNDPKPVSGRRPSGIADSRRPNRTALTSVKPSGCAAAGSLSQAREALARHPAPETAVALALLNEGQATGTGRFENGR